MDAEGSATDVDEPNEAEARRADGRQPLAGHGIMARARERPDPTHLGEEPRGEDAWPGATRTDSLLPAPSLVVARGLVWAVLLLLAALLVWSACTRVDVVVLARGRLTVAGEPLRVAAPQPGLVVGVHTEVGARVRPGNLLLELDASDYRAAADQLAAQMRVIEAEHARRGREAEAALERQEPLRRERGETEAIARQIDERLASEQLLLERGILAPTSTADRRRERGELAIRVARIDAGLVELEHAAEQARQLAAEAARRLEVLRIELDRQRACAARCRLVAPCEATVAHLAVRHPGDRIGVEAPAVVLLPADRPLLACVRLPNGARRRLAVGLAVRLELDAFPRQDFGYLHGHLQRVEPDADEAGNYVGWVALDPAASTRFVGLQPGLMANARILVDSRTALELALEPLLGLRGSVEVSP